MDLRDRCRIAVLVPLISITPHVAYAAACHDEADRLADRHALRVTDAPAQPQDTAASPRAQAEQLLSAARKADDDGIVEQCLRQLAQARELIQNGAATQSGPRR